MKWNEELIKVGDEELRISLLHNQYYECPIEISCIVRPLVNALLTQADLWEAKGNIPEAEKLHKQALELASKYLEPSDRANMERSLVSSLTSRVASTRL
jgi:hypothetical protein